MRHRMTKVGFYAGSFDPVTNGHMDIIKRSLAVVDELVIGVGKHHGKKGLFSPDERVEMLKESVAGFTGVHIVTFDNLVVDAARDNNAQLIIRGLRDTTDFDYEVQMAGMNGSMAGDIETVFLASSSEVRHIAAKFVRQIAAMNGDVSNFVPSCVLPQLKQKFVNS